MVPGLAEVHHRIKVGGLSGRGQHGCHSALQLANFRRYCVVGGISQSGIKISALLLVEYLKVVL